MNQLSSYILTKNSEKYLETILRKIGCIVDEIVIVDSGSTDRTKEIALTFKNVKWIYRCFDDFKSQRNFAAQHCTYPYVLFLDSDEIPNDAFINSLKTIKAKGFEHDAYAVARKWIVLGKEIHCLYPIKSPDFPIRVINKQCVNFGEKSNQVHETPVGYKSKLIVEGELLHYTFHSKEELYRKLEHYTQIAALDLLKRHKSVNVLKIIFNPLSAFFKWFIIKGGYKDGRVGFILAKYAYLYTLQKYLKAKKAK
jgi:glycosyltransferase involved in cell wall biosynthesis